MSLESGYVINVARRMEGEHRLRYYHLFRTDKIPATEERRAKEVYEQFLTKFSAPEYAVTMTLWDIRGTEVSSSKGVENL